MNEIQIFNNPEFGEIRTVMIDGEPWFAGKDVATALGYKDTNAATRKNVDLDDKRVCPLGTPFGVQKLTVINESGLYSLIFGSKLESAKKFKRWVTSEVLPQIRKNGQYQIAQIQNNPLKLLEVHYQAIKQVDGKVDALAERVDRIEFDLPILPVESDKITAAARKKGVEILGGKDTPAYHNKGLRQKVYSGLYSNLRYNFGVTTYKAIKRSQLEMAMDVIERYSAPVFITSEIESINKQQTIW